MWCARSGTRRTVLVCGVQGVGLDSVSVWCARSGTRRTVLVCGVHGVGLDVQC